MARDDARADSDVDLLVDVPPGVSAFVLGAMLMDAQDLLGRRVDIVTRSALNPALRERVLREAKRL
jgi:predicted nucleotidyltransferase